MRIPDRQQVLVPVLVALPPTWEILIQFLVLVCGLAQPQVLEAFEYISAFLIDFFKAFKNK